MMMNILQFIVILAVFFPVKYLTWRITNEWGLPEWLRYKPWECELCLCFWLLVGIYTAILFSFSWLYTGIGGIILAVLNAIAMYVDQRNKTIKIEDI